MKYYTVNENLAGLRLDVGVQTLYPKLSRASVQKLCKFNSITVNGKVERSSYKLRVDDKINITFDEFKESEIPEIDLKIIYEDDDCIVICKPIGVLSHSKGAFNPEATVASWLRPKLTSSYSGDRAGIVHRLDRATSGVMIMAKTPEALLWIQKQFSKRKVKKVYNAIINGFLEPPEAIIEMPIERNPKMPATFRVGVNGKPAITHFKTLKSNENFSLVELRPQTGRTHQLRVHLAELGHPIVGDTLYGGQIANRMFLHALSLELTLPNKERKVFMTELPYEFNELIE